MKTTRKKFLVFAVAIAWLFCDILSQTALAAFLPASYFQGAAKSCVVVAPKSAAAPSCCPAMKKAAASTRAMSCNGKVEHHAAASASKTLAQPAAQCRCEARPAPAHSQFPPAPGAAKNLRASLDDNRKPHASYSSPLIPTLPPRISLAPPRAFRRRLERVSKPRFLSSAPPLPGRAPPVFS